MSAPTPTVPHEFPRSPNRCFLNAGQGDRITSVFQVTDGATWEHALTNAPTVRAAEPRVGARLRRRTGTRPGSAIRQHLVQPCRPGSSQRLFDAAVLRDHRAPDGQLQALGRRCL